MSTLSVRIPDSLHAALRRLSRKDKVSINQFIASAVAEKVTALETETLLQERAARGNPEAYRRVLGKVRDVPPDRRDG